MNDLFDGLEPKETYHEPFFDVLYCHQTKDWVVIIKTFNRFSYPVKSHHSTELEAVFYAEKYQKEQDSNHE